MTPLQRTPQTPQQPLAIVGTSVRIADVDTPETFWRILIEGRRGVSKVPLSRWDATEVMRCRSDIQRINSLQWGGFIKDIEYFDSDFFGVSPTEALTMDPQQRLVMEVGYQCVENAGWTLRELEGSNTGIYVAMSSYDYNRLFGQDLTSIDANAAIGTSLFAAPNRLSWFLRVAGPSMAVDAACASSLVALHQAHRALSSGEIDIALVGGVNAILSPDVMISFAQTTLLSQDGHIRSFDASADGYVRSEACGMIALMRLEDAETSGREVLALVRGVELSQTGPRHGFVTPNGLAQHEVIRRTWKSAGVGAEDIGYVEAHASGTSIGDMIELSTLSQLFGDPSHHGCRVGSYKPNFGYPECASGIISLIKAVKIFEHGVIPGQIDLEQPSDGFNDEGVEALQLSTEPVQWHTDDRNCIGINAFGVGGTYAHTVLEAPPQAKQRTLASALEQAPSRLVLPISAVNLSSLKNLVRDYAARLVNSSAPKQVWALCQAAAVHRDHFPYRVLVWATNAEALARQLDDGLELPQEPIKRRPKRVQLRFDGSMQWTEPFPLTVGSTHGINLGATFRRLTEVAHRTALDLDQHSRARITIHAVVSILREWGLPVESVVLGGEWTIALRNNPARQTPEILSELETISATSITDDANAQKARSGDLPIELGRSAHPLDALLETISSAYRAGFNPNWSSMINDHRVTDRKAWKLLPRYPFERHRYWIGNDPRTSSKEDKA